MHPCPTPPRTHAPIFPPLYALIYPCFYVPMHPCRRTQQALETWQTLSKTAVTPSTILESGVGQVPPTHHTGLAHTHVTAGTSCTNKLAVTLPQVCCWKAREEGQGAGAGRAQGHVFVRYCAGLLRKRSPTKVFSVCES